jgi:intein/homing endonuclease
MPSTRVIGFQIWKDDLINFKKRLGLPLGPKNEIGIPQAFLSNPKIKKAVLRGIFDTDGGIYLQRKYGRLYPRIAITTTSFKLSEQLLKLFKELEFRVTRYSQLYPRGRDRKRSYIVGIRGIEMFHKFIKEISPQNPKHVRKYKHFLTSQNL